MTLDSVGWFSSALVYLLGSHRPVLSERVESRSDLRQFVICHHALSLVLGVLWRELFPRSAIGGLL